MRYFEKIKETTQYDFYAQGLAAYANDVRMIYFYKTRKRSIPTLSFSGSFLVQFNSQSSSPSSISADPAINQAVIRPAGITISANTPATFFDGGNVDSAINISAEL